MAAADARFNALREPAAIFKSDSAAPRSDTAGLLVTSRRADVPQRSLLSPKRRLAGLGGGPFRAPRPVRLPPVRRLCRAELRVGGPRRRRGSRPRAARRGRRPAAPAPSVPAV